MIWERGLRRGGMALALLGLALLDGTPAAADVEVSGAVSGLWRADWSPYLVRGNLSLSSDDTLTIQPGVEVIFQGRFGFTVYGFLSAVGQGADSIVFRGPAVGRDQWVSIKFSGRNAGYSRLQRCVLSGGYRGVELDNSSPTLSECHITLMADDGIRMVGSSPQVEDCVIENVLSVGIAVTERSNPTIIDCRLFNCGDYGLGIGNLSAGTFNGLWIDRTGDHGIYLNGTGACRIQNCVVLNAGVRGISAEQSPNCEFIRNVVYRSTGPGIFVTRCDNASILGNTIWEAGNSGIQVYAGSASVLSNIIAYSNQYGLFVQGANVAPDFNDLWANRSGAYSGAVQGRSDLSQDPQLVNPALGDFHPREGSPVIDAGYPGLRDPDGTRADIGAWFFNQNHPPEITDWSPRDLDSTVGDQEIEFAVTAIDPDGHQLSYTWYLDDTRAGTGAVWRHTFNRDGQYAVKVVVDDGWYLGTTALEWHFRVYGAAVGRPPAVPAGFYVEQPYPNPFNSVLHLELFLPARTEVSAVLIDLLGRPVGRPAGLAFAQGRQTLTLNGSDLSSGPYLLKVTGAGEVRHFPVLLTR